VAQMHSILLGAAAHHVTVIASSGDSGASSDPRWGTPFKEVSLPASDPLVLAVGGTALTANPSTGAYLGETAWGGQTGLVQAGGGSGGGFSHLYARPAYQDGVPGMGAMRGVPDVAGAAGGAGGDLSVVFADGSKTWVVQAGGTSASAPLWGGLITLADQYARHDLGFVNPAIYRVARSSSYHKAFHDVTDGSNTVTIGTVVISGYQAGPGWNPVTGWGSPDTQVLVPLLARLTSRAVPAVAVLRVGLAVQPGLDAPAQGRHRERAVVQDGRVERGQRERRAEAPAGLIAKPLDLQLAGEVGERLSGQDDVPVDLGRHELRRHGDVADRVLHGLLPAPAERVHAGVHDQPDGPHQGAADLAEQAALVRVQPGLLGDLLGVQAPPFGEHGQAALPLQRGQVGEQLQAR